MYAFSLFCFVFEKALEYNNSLLGRMAHNAYILQKPCVSNVEGAELTSSHVLKKKITLLEKGGLEKALFVSPRTCSKATDAPFTAWSITDIAHTAHGSCTERSCGFKGGGV